MCTLLQNSNQLMNQGLGNLLGADIPCFHETVVCPSCEDLYSWHPNWDGVFSICIICRRSLLPILDKATAASSRDKIL